MQRTKFAWVPLCAFALLVCNDSTAHGAFSASLATTAVRQTGGQVLYTYTLSVPVSSTLSATEFDMAVFGPVNVASITAPSNFFSFYNPGDPDVSFIAFDAGILPGTNGVFSFTSPLNAIAQPYLIRGLDSTTFSTASVTGTSLAPSSLPEPASLVMATFGAISVFGMVVIERRRRRTV